MQAQLFYQELILWTKYFKSMIWKHTLSSANTESEKNGPRNDSFSNSIPAAGVIGSGNQLDCSTICRET